MKAYKSFDNDWKCNNFQYEIGKTYEHVGELVMCGAGFHACKNPIDVFTYYPFVPWGKFAEVELDGEILGKDEDKQCANKITIVKEISFEDFVKLCKDGVNVSEGVNRSHGVDVSEGVNKSNGVNGSNGVNVSEGVNRSHGVNWSEGVNWSNGVNRSHGVNRSEGVNWSNGVNVSEGVNWSNGVNNSLFVNNIKRSPILFNIEVSEKRIKEVKNKYYNIMGDWSPTFNNLKSLYLKNGSEWKRTPISNAEEISKKEAWEGMPKKAIEYLQSLPEFDATVFEEVTGIKVKV